MAGNLIVQGVVAVAVLGLAYKKVQAIRAKSTFQAEVQAHDKNRVYLFMAFQRGSFPAKGVPHFGGNFLKLEAWCRLHKVPYEVKFGSNYPALSPSETMPFVALNGELCGDSELCLEWLAKKLGKPLYDGELTTDAQKATALGIRRMVEWHCIPQSSRQLIVDNTDVMKKIFGALVPFPQIAINMFVGQFRKATINRLNTSGMGWQSDARCQEEFTRDFVALEQLIQAQGSDGFLLTKDAPTAIDTVVYGLLAPTIDFGRNSDCKSPVLRYVAESKVLTAYAARLTTRLFPNMDELADGKPQRFF